MGIRLKEIMHTFGLNQAGMAGVIGVTAAQMSRWILGQNEMPQPTAMAFQAALGIRWQWLLNGEGEMLLAKRETVTDNEKILLDLMANLSDADQQYLIGAARALTDAKGKK